MLKQFLRIGLAALVAHAALSSGALGATGRTAGTFEVSATGAATYTIPLWVVPGPHGMQPNISLVYNSQQGDGPLGVGWSIQGTSTITRCNRTVAQDGTAAPITLTNADGFCLDGKRLRLTSSEDLSTYGADGTTYQTETANFINVTAHGVAGNGPSYFTAQTADGQTWTYGSGYNSRVQATGTSTALEWRLVSVSDKFNGMKMSYLPPSQNLTGSTALGQIYWTLSAKTDTTYDDSVVFLYGTPNASNPHTSGYVAGTVVLNSQVLTDIEVWARTTYPADTVVKHYVLGYTPSPTTGHQRLTSITECADETATNCLAPTIFTYQDGGKGVNVSSPVVSFPVK